MPLRVIVHLHSVTQISPVTWNQVPGPCTKGVVMEPLNIRVNGLPPMWTLRLSGLPSGIDVKGYGNFPRPFPRWRVY